MDLFAPRHLLIILVVCLVVFGTKKLKTLGADLGGAVKGFKQAMKEAESDEPAPAHAAAAASPPQPELAAPASPGATTTNQSTTKAA